MTNNESMNDEIMSNDQCRIGKFGILIYLVILVSSFVIIPPAFAEVELGGYYENLALSGTTRTGENISGDLNTLRLRIDAQLKPNVSLHLEPEYNLLIRSADLPLTGVADLDRLNWDRAYFKIYFPQADLTLGRQRIAWGTGYVWNPTDVFNPFTMSFAVKEEQEKDVEAVRVEAPFGSASGLDAFVLTGDEWQNLKKGIRVNANVGIYDLSLSYADRGAGSFQLGFDTVGELLGLGVRAEYAMVSPTSEGRYSHYVAGANYTFENGWGVETEYYFNGAGKKKKDDYDWTGLLAGDITQLAQDYFYFDLHKMLDEITGVRFSLLLNADDLSYIFYPAYSRNLRQNLDLSFEAMLMQGEDGSEYHPTSDDDPSGLIGSNLVFMRIRYSF